MSSTERFRRQHLELLTLAGKLVAELSPEAIADNPAPARSALAAFTGKLKIHAVMENEAFYPRLFASDDPQVRATAKALFHEVEDIYTQVTQFASTWASASAIGADPERFVRETQEVLGLLGQRMARENTELYPLVEDALDGTA